MEEQKKLVRLVAEEPFFNHVDVAICDFGGPGGGLRRRGRISVDYGPPDIRQMQQTGICTLEEALAQYRQDIEQTVRRYLLTDFVLEEGNWEELLQIVATHIQDRFPTAETMQGPASASAAGTMQSPASASAAEIMQSPASTSAAGTPQEG